MTKTNYTFKSNSKDMLSLLAISKIATLYNKILFKYTKGFAGKIAVPKTDVSAIPKKFMTIAEYLNSKPAWKQIAKFMSEANIKDINDYLEVMIRNWPQISTIINMNDRKIPLSSIIFSVKMSSMYDRFKTKELDSANINKHLALKISEDFNRLTPSLQSNINSLFRLKSLNSNLTFKEIVQLFTGEFEQEFISIILDLDETEITYEKLSKMFI